MDNKSNKETIYKLEAIDHISYSDGECEEEIMLIGFFDSLATCAIVENDYKTCPGFSLPSCRFVITPYSLSLAKNSMIKRVFYVQEWIFDEQSGDETITEIGVFTTLKEAEEQKSIYLATKTLELTDQIEYGDSIYIDEYRINERH